MIHPLLAVDFGSLISILFLLIAFLGWMMQLVGGKDEPPARNAGGGERPRQGTEQDRLQHEIDAFLKEASGGKKAGPTQAEDVPIEIVSEEERHRHRAGRQAPQAAVGAHPQQAQGRQSGGLLSSDSKRFQTEQLGNEVRSEHLSHLRTGEVDHLETYLEQHQLGRLPHDSTHAEETPVTGQAHPAPKLQSRATKRTGPALGAGQLAAFLRDPQQMRQAIVLHEILTPVGQQPHFRRRL